MNEPFQHNQLTTPTTCALRPHPESDAPLTEADITGDIERLIVGIVSPYVDFSNPMLHFDEMQAECRAKVALILHTGVLSKCATRAKVFAFIKTALKNHISSLVQKHAFTEKRGGIKPRRAKGKQTGQRKLEGWTKAVVLRLDDVELGVQIGRLDHAVLFADLLEEIHVVLTPKERAVLDWLVSPSNKHSDNDWPQNAVGTSLLAAHGITQHNFEDLKEKVLCTCRATLCR